MRLFKSKKTFKLKPKYNLKDLIKEMIDYEMEKDKFLILKF